MRRHYLLPVVMMLQMAACGGKSGDTTATATAKPDDKKSADKKVADSASAKPTSATSASAAKPETSSAPLASAAASAAASSAPSTAPASGLAGLFTGDIDPSIKFEKQAQVPNKPVWMQVVPYWKLNTDAPPDDGPPWDYVSVDGTEGHATIYLWTQKPSAAGIDPTDLSNHLAWTHVTDAKFDAAIDGVIGKGIKVKIAEGKGTMMTKPAKVWWMAGDIEGGEQLLVFAVLRSDVYPKLEGDLKAMLQSIKIQHG